MIFTSFLTIFLLSSCWANENSSDDEISFVGSLQGTASEEIPFVVAFPGNSNEPKVSSLLPEDLDVPPVVGAQSPTNKGRSDIDIEDDQPSGGYFYPKPARPLQLPEFKTLDAAVQLDAAFAEENSQRQPRSPQRRRRPQYYRPNQSPPPFIPGFIPPNQIRPLPALYGRPSRY